MAGILIKQAGEWKGSTPIVKTGGDLLPVMSGHIKVNGEWRECYAYDWLYPINNWYAWFFAPI